MVSFTDLVDYGVLEHAIWLGKPRYRPTEKFADLVAQSELDLMLAKKYIITYNGMLEEGTRIALSKTIPRAGKKKIRKYTELASTFEYFDRMDRDLNPQSDRYRHGKPEKPTSI